ncbi:hypothetical protein [Campylobacter sp.]|uniref:DUF7768 domain-containing protein n=1 Tax=Campylobacter sp. TaxID=205 RepID=UPI002A7570C5|nr:hypothetical protein [Campylobacter sp.]MDY3246586.1 hypothetical protein [Campylobacter sp.]
MSKLVYIASPFRKIQDKEFAVLLAEKACDEVARMGFYPVSPVLLWAGRISENNSEERAKNLEASSELLKACAFIYVAKSKHSLNSVGIKAELDLARELNIKELKISKEF